MARIPGAGRRAWPHPHHGRRQRVYAVASLLVVHRTRTSTPLQTIRATFQRMRGAVNDTAIFIALPDDTVVLSEAAALAARQ